MNTFVSTMDVTLEFSVISFSHSFEALKVLKRIVFPNTILLVQILSWIGGIYFSNINNRES